MLRKQNDQCGLDSYGSGSGQLVAAEGMVIDPQVPLNVENLLTS